MNVVDVFPQFGRRKYLNYGSLLLHIRPAAKIAQY
jgi:hypothetical protein